MNLNDSTEGRWLTPDLLGGDITNPQSLNRYAYVLNNPTTLTDPTGLGPNDCGPTSICIVVPVLPNPPGLGGGIGECPSFGCTPNCSIFVCGAAPWNNNGGGGGTIHITSYGTSGGGSASAAPKPAPPAASPKGACGVTPPQFTAGQYFSGVASAATMFGEFLTGSGPSNLTFGPASVQSQMMASSPGVTQAVNNYQNKGESTGLYTFGFGGLWDAGANPIQQFVGSYRYSVVPTNGGLNISLTNRTSLWSGSYHVLPNHSRSTFAPLGNTYQTYQVFVPCHS